MLFWVLGDIDPSGLIVRGVTLITYQVRFIFIIRYIDDINDCADFLSLRDQVFYPLKSQCTLPSFEEVRTETLLATFNPNRNATL